MEKNIIYSYLRFQVLKKGIEFEEVKKICYINRISYKEFLIYLKNYVLTNGTQEEKEQYALFIEKIKKEKRKLSQLNPILLKLGIETMYLYENEEQRMQMGKFIFEYCQENGVTKGYKELSAQYGISINQISEMHNHYQIHSGNNHIHLQYPMSTVSVPTKVDESFNKIIELLTKEEQDLNKYKENNYTLSETLKSEIQKVIDDSGYRAYELKERVLGYITKYQLDDIYYELLRNILSQFNKRIKNDNNDKFDSISNLITSYAESDLSIGEFCNKVGMSIDSFYELIENVKIENSRLYNYFQNVILSHETIVSFINSNFDLLDFRDKNNISTKNMTKLLECVKSNNEELYKRFNKHVEEMNEIVVSKLQILVKYLRNGIDTNGIIRPFSIIDYFILVGLNFRCLMAYSMLLDDVDDRILTAKFYSKYEKYVYSLNTVQKNVANIDFSLKCLDKSGNGENIITLTNEQKVNILEYLKSKNIPLNDYTIYEAFRLYATGSLLGYTEENNKGLSSNSR